MSLNHLANHSHSCSPPYDAGYAASAPPVFPYRRNKRHNRAVHANAYRILQATHHTSTGAGFGLRACRERNYQAFTARQLYSGRVLNNLLYLLVVHL